MGGEVEVSTSEPGGCFFFFKKKKKKHGLALRLVHLLSLSLDTLFPSAFPIVMYTRPHLRLVVVSVSSFCGTCQAREQV